MRLDKFISSQTSFSRSECRKLIQTGRVRVEGLNWVNADTKIDVNNSNVFVDGNAITFKEYVYYVMNKPAGVLSACNDKSKKTVVDLLKENDRYRAVFPVGRLDKDTTGLLLLTDDGDTAHKIINPKSKIEKTYIAVLDGQLKQDDILSFKKGIVLADGTLCEPAILEIIDENTALVKITEGKYHQIKRMFGVIGLGVVELSRIKIGNLSLDKNILPGDYIEISFEDIKRLILT